LTLLPAEPCFVARRIGEARAVAAFAVATVVRRIEVNFVNIKGGEEFPRLRLVRAAAKRPIHGVYQLTAACS
jgi:hypothetical protein